MTPEFALVRANMADLPCILTLVEDLHNAEHIVLDENDRASAVQTLIECPEIGGIWVFRVESEVIGYIAIAYGFSITLWRQGCFSR